MKIVSRNLDPFEIEFDEYSFTVHEKYISESAEGEKREATKIVGYFTSAESAVKRIARIKLSRKDEVVDLKEFLVQYDNIFKSLMKNNHLEP